MPKTFTRCTGCDKRLLGKTICASCEANGGKPADPYADVSEVIAAETDPRRVEVSPTPKRLTDASPSYGRTRS